LVSELKRLHKSSGLSCSCDSGSSRGEISTIAAVVIVVVGATATVVSGNFVVEVAGVAPIPTTFFIVYRKIVNEALSCSFGQAGKAIHFMKGKRAALWYLFFKKEVIESNGLVSQGHGCVG